MVTYLKFLDSKLEKSHASSFPLQLHFLVIVTMILIRIIIS